jgi:hypothetical protein
VAFLAQHYDKGSLLVNVYATNIDLAPANIPFRNEIYEGDGALWRASLADPASYADWIIAAPHDLVSQHINLRSLAFQREFVSVAQDSSTGAELWHRKGLPELPTRPLPADAIAPYATCNRVKQIPLASGQFAPTPVAWSGETRRARSL